MAPLLTCNICKKPPRPGGSIRIGKCQNRCHSYDLRTPLCDSCHHCPNGWAVEEDPFLSNLVQTFQKYTCIYYKNGCKEEMEANDLKKHEENCKFRDVTCPKDACNSKFTSYGMLEHFKIAHTPKIVDDVLEFKGSIEDLKKNTFILNSFGRPFFPQFKIDDNILHVWVVGNGDQDEMVCTIYFFVIEAIEVKFQAKVKTIQKEQDVMKVPLKTIDVKMERFQDQEFIWFQMKITSKKFE